MSRAVNIFIEDVEILDVKGIILKKYIKKILSLENAELGTINIIFCSDPKLLSINQEYLNHNTLTDIITFDFCKEFGNVSGDIFISYDRVKDNSERLHIKLFLEVCRVVFHGVLHLLGYNDHTKEEIEIIRQKEDFYLNLLCSDV